METERRSTLVVDFVAREYAGFQGQDYEEYIVLAVYPGTEDGGQLTGFVLTFCGVLWMIKWVFHWVKLLIRW